MINKNKRRKGTCFGLDRSQIHLPLWSGLIKAMTIVNPKTIKEKVEKEITKMRMRKHANAAEKGVK